MKPFLSVVIASLLLTASATADEGHSSFWSKTDEWLKKGADLLSKEDRITGFRSLNLTSDDESKRRGNETIETILAEAERQNVRSECDAADVGKAQHTSTNCSSNACCWLQAN